MAITTLTSGENGANSLIDVNANFVDLDTTKADLASPTFTGTPTLPTGTIATTQSAGNSSTKVATTAFVANSLGTAVVTIIPKPGVVSTGAVGLQVDTGTTARVGLVHIPFPINANKISVQISSVNVSGVIKIGLYSESGQTQLFNVSTASISGAGVTITSIASQTAILAGNYYIVLVPVGTFQQTVLMHATEITSNMYLLNKDVTSKPVLEGTLTVTTGTLPTTFTPSSITTANNSTLAFRLDN